MNLQNLSLAHRANKTVLGTDYVIENLRKKKVVLIILASDASELTKKKINDKAKTYQTEVISDITSEELSRTLGKKVVKVVGITDRGFSQLVR